MEEKRGLSKAKIISVVIAVIMLIAIIVCAMLSKRGYRVIAVEAFNGITTVLNNAKETTVYEGLHMKTGDEVSVHEESDLTLALDNDKYVYAQPLSHFYLEAAGKSSNSKTVLKVDDGSVVCRIDKKLLESEEFKVQTPNAVMSVRGTVFRVTLEQDENGAAITKLEVLEGEVEAVRLDENGNMTEDKRNVVAGKCVRVRTNPDDTEFVEDDCNENDILSDDYRLMTKGTAQFLGRAIDEGRQLCIEKDLLFHYVSLMEHTYGDKVETVEATCTKEGYTSRLCLVCGEKEDGSITIPKKEHKPVEEIKNDATCTVVGTKVSKCNVCGKVLEEIELPALGHKYEIVDTKPANCQHDGLETSKCSACGAVSEKVLPRTWHVLDYSDNCIYGCGYSEAPEESASDNGPTACSHYWVAYNPPAGAAIPYREKCMICGATR